MGAGNLQPAMIKVEPTRVRDPKGGGYTVSDSPDTLIYLKFETHTNEAVNVAVRKETEVKVRSIILFEGALYEVMEIRFSPESTFKGLTIKRLERPIDVKTV